MYVVDEQLLTVTEAAELLRVAPSTIRRWIRDGDVRAYRVGKRRVGLRRSDLAAVVEPTRTRGQDDRGGITIPELTEEEWTRGIAAVERLRERHRAYRESGRTDHVTPSWVLINEAREERSKQLEDY
jgi:excisionase family DNA binding protein